MMSDDRLARRAVKGDERAFAAIFRRYHQSLYRFCLAIVGDSQDAEDALQNTMVKALRALPGEQRRIELKPWLYRIAHNESIELLRRRRETRQLDPELAGSGPGLAEEAAVRERLRRLIADLDELPERQRGALVMRELGGLDFGEIAVALGTSPAVARQTLYEARLSLRQMDEGRSMSCETATRVLSDGDGRVARRRDVRAHLRTCASCRSFREEIEAREHDLAALSPLPAMAAAGLLHGLLGGGHGAGGGGFAGVLGGGAAKSAGTSALLKGAAAVVVVAAIGVGAADRGGVIDTGIGDGNGPPATRVAPTGVDRTDAASSRMNGSLPAAGLSRAAAPRAAAVHLGMSQQAKAAGKPVGSQGGRTSVEATVTPTPQAATHPHGAGHVKELPSASAHGQRTAAAHGGVKQGSSGGQGQVAHPAKPTHPTHPVHPTHPSTPGSKTGSSSPPGNGASHATHPESSKATPTEGPEEASSAQGTGKKP